jgi:hypothetical protein
LRKKIFTLLLCTLFLSISLSTLAYAETEKETNTSESIHIAAFGSSVLIGIRRVGCMISNTGETSLHNVSWSFTVKRTENNETVFTHTDIKKEFPPEMSTIFSVNLPFDVGFLELTATATCSDLQYDASNTITVYQVGPICLGRIFLLSSLY